MPNDLGYFLHFLIFGERFVCEHRQRLAWFAGMTSVVFVECVLRLMHALFVSLGPCRLTEVQHSPQSRNLVRLRLLIYHPQLMGVQRRLNIAWHDTLCVRWNPLDT